MNCYEEALKEIGDLSYSIAEAMVTKWINPPAASDTEDHSDAPTSPDTRETHAQRSESRPRRAHVTLSEAWEAVAEEVGALPVYASPSSDGTPLYVVPGAQGPQSGIFVEERARSLAVIRGGEETVFPHEMGRTGKYTPSDEEYRQASALIGPVDGENVTFLFHENAAPCIRAIHRGLCSADRRHRSAVRKAFAAVWQQMHGSGREYTVVPIARPVPLGMCAVELKREPETQDGMRMFHVPRDYWQFGQPIFNRTRLIFEPGRTVLVGANGTGKSTLMRAMEDQLKKAKISVRRFDSQGNDSAHNLMEMFQFQGNVAGLAETATSSEGEKMNIGLLRFVGNLRQLIEQAGDECWILLDGLDSGYSIDNVIEWKHLLKLIERDAEEKSVRLYVVWTANTYEAAAGERCLDPKTGKYVEFDSYDQYRDFIIASRRRKDKRDGAGECAFLAWEQESN